MILECDPIGPCRGFEGNCGDMQDQFAGVQGPYVYGMPPEEHDLLDDYLCTAFPDDAFVTDQLLVALISVAVALPVELFLARAFEIANEIDDAPECWLDAPPGIMRPLLGKDAHGDWHFTDAEREQPVSELIKWFVRRGSEPLLVAALRLIAWLRARWCGDGGGGRGSDEEAQADAQTQQCCASSLDYHPDVAAPSDAAAGDELGGDDATSSSSSSSQSSSDARADALQKRLFASTGLLGVYMCWTIFAWFIFVRHARRRGATRAVRVFAVASSSAAEPAAESGGVTDVARRRVVSLCAACCFQPFLPALPQTYGMLIYKTLGPSAQEEFSKTWGIGCASVPSATDRAAPHGRTSLRSFVICTRPPAPRGGGTWGCAGLMISSCSCTHTPSPPPGMR
jgi:hypothetical protein